MLSYLWMQIIIFLYSWSMEWILHIVNIVLVLYLHFVFYATNCQAFDQVNILSWYATSVPLYVGVIYSPQRKKSYSHTQPPSTY